MLRRAHAVADRIADRISEAIAWRVGDRLLGRGARVVSPAPFCTGADAERERLDTLMTLTMLVSVLEPAASYLDVGADKAQFLAHAVRLAPEGRHVAWEPIGHLAEDLRARFPGVEVREAALGDASGRAPFIHVLEEEGLSGLRDRPFPGDKPREMIEVAVERLDDVLDPALRPAVIKVDVEGGELAVFRGARETLARHRPHVVFEHTTGGATHHDATPEEVWDVLAECGLRVFDLEGNGPLSRDAFVDSFHLRSRHNYLARP